MKEELSERPQNILDKLKDFLRETLLPISYCTLNTRMALKWWGTLRKAGVATCRFRIRRFFD